MDDRTARLLESLDPVGASLLLELLSGPQREVDLLAVEKALGQPTGNRRLHRLKDAGLIHQEPGKPHAPGRSWSVLHPAETEALVSALVTLAEAIDTRERREREATKRKLKRARAERLGIREAGARGSANRYHGQE